MRPLSVLDAQALAWSASAKRAPAGSGAGAGAGAGAGSGSGAGARSRLRSGWPPASTRPQRRQAVERGGSAAFGFAIVAVREHGREERVFAPVVGGGWPSILPRSRDARSARRAAPRDRTENRSSPCRAAPRSATERGRTRTRPRCRPTPLGLDAPERMMASSAAASQPSISAPRLPRQGRRQRPMPRRWQARSSPSTATRSPRVGERRSPRHRGHHPRGRRARRRATRI